VGGEEVAAFIPEPLPPHDPALTLDGGVASLLLRAEAALSRLDLASAMVPSVGWFLYSFVRKEAVISSQIEGTQATLMDLFAYEAAGKAESSETDDVQEVCNYLDAIAFARKQVKSPKGLPISVRLLCETHRRLMKGVRGAEKRPGEIRRSQNWIGGTRRGNAAYVPPPPHAVGELLAGLERFIHGESDLPPLIRAGLCHAQFETIHPFLDGNGRIGRLLIALLFEHWKLLRELCTQSTRVSAGRHEGAPIKSATDAIAFQLPSLIVSSEAAALLQSTHPTAPLLLRLTRSGGSFKLRGRAWRSSCSARTRSVAHRHRPRLFARAVQARTGCQARPPMDPPEERAPTRSQETPTAVLSGPSASGSTVRAS